MPELPEVETVRRGLQPVLEGKRLQKVSVFRSDLRFPLPSELSRRLTGARVHGIDRRAKYLLFHVGDDMIWLSHLGMSGRYRVYKDDPPPREPHDHVEVITEDDVTIRYNDPRRFGFMDLFHVDELPTHKLLAGIGPEPLSNAFDASSLAANLGDKKTAIKVALLDQHVVAGVGNIYASEALFRARISPRRMARTVKGGRAARVADAVRDVLADAIGAGGSSLRDHRQTSGELGYFQHSFRVYGRAGELCPRCGEDHHIKQIVQGGRATFYCSNCQR